MDNTKEVATQENLKVLSDECYENYANKNAILDDHIIPISEFLNCDLNNINTLNYGGSIDNLFVKTIRNMGNLETLNLTVFLEKPGAINLRFLEEINKLKYLKLNFEHPRHHRNVDHLGITIENFSSIAHQTELNTLILEKNHSFMTTDFSFLCYMDKLRYVDLSYSTFEYLGVLLASKDTLEELRIQETNVRDIALLNKFPNLKKVQIR